MERRGRGFIRNEGEAKCSRVVEAEGTTLTAHKMSAPDGAELEKFERSELKFAQLNSVRSYFTGCNETGVTSQWGRAAVPQNPENAESRGGRSRRVFRRARYPVRPVRLQHQFINAGEVRSAAQDRLAQCVWCRGGF